MLSDDLPADVKKKLADYQKQVEKSFEQEFKVEDSKLAGAKTATRDQIADLAPMACQTLAELMEFSDSDATRFNASKFVLEKVLGRDTVLDPDDPMQKVIERLTVASDVG